MRATLRSLLVFAIAGLLGAQNPPPLAVDLKTPFPIELAPRRAAAILELDLAVPAACTVRCLIGGRVHGMVTGRADSAPRRTVQAPLPPTDEAETWMLSSHESGAELLAYRVVPAAIFAIEIAAAETGRTCPGVVRVLALDGHGVPQFLETPSQPNGESALLLESGKGELFLPAGLSATLVGFQTPFREPVRHRVRGQAGRTATLRFLLGPDRLPEGATLLAPPAPSNWRPVAIDRWDRSLGIGRRTEIGLWLRAEDVYRDAPALWPMLLGPEGTDIQFASGAPLELPLDPRRFLTVRLKDGRLLHSNGPLLLAKPFARHLEIGPTGRVSGEVAVFLPPSVSDGILRLRTHAGVAFEQRVTHRGEPLSIALQTPPATRAILEFEGSGFAKEGPAHPIPRAWLVMLLP